MEMCWKLLILVSACLLGHVTRALESQISDDDAISTSSKAPDNGVNETVASPLALTTTTSATTEVDDTPKDCPSCECGITAFFHLVTINGNETEPGEFTWMALLLNKGEFFCGGTLINDLYVLTAAHCTVRIRKEQITVRFLEHDRFKSNETTTFDRKVSEIIRHRKYNTWTENNDIALLKLDQRVDFSKPRKQFVARSGVHDPSEIKEISPVCLPSPQLSYAGDYGLQVGWGNTQEDGSLSNTLQEVFVPIISNEDCRKTRYKNRITDNMMCAGFVDEGGKDACQGDSGGPLHVINRVTHQFQEVGIVSWGEGCARPGYPGVYTRVNRYLTWIKSNTKDACYCQ